VKILSTCFSRSFPVWTLPEWAADEVRRRFPEVQVVRLTSPESILREIADADCLFATVVKDAHIHAARRLKWIHTPSAGLEWILTPALVASDVTVTNSKGALAIPVAEHALALMLALSRRLHHCFDDQRRGVSRREDLLRSTPSFEELSGKTVGVIGLGSIGTQIARLCGAFGMRVVGFRRNPDGKPEFVERIYPPSMLDAELPSLDYVVVAAPLTIETRGMLGKNQFERMKPTAYLINVARGEIIDQDALADAVETERIAGAGLDVTQPDPLPDGHPLHSAKNILITPHVSGLSPMLWRRLVDLWIENIQRFLEGRELINTVTDKTRGY